MEMDKFINSFSSLFKPVRSVFSFYLLMYLIPLVIPLYIAFTLKDVLILEGKLNTSIAILLSICCFTAVGWTIFYLIFFTKQRTSNPELYEKGFLSEIRIKEREKNHVN